MSTSASSSASSSATSAPTSRARPTTSSSTKPRSESSRSSTQGPRVRNDGRPRAASEGDQRRTSGEGDSRRASADNNPRRSTSGGGGSSRRGRTSTRTYGGAPSGAFGDGPRRPKQSPSRRADAHDALIDAQPPLSLGENRHQRVEIPQGPARSPAVAEEDVFTGIEAKTFGELEMILPLKETLKGLGYTEPTPIQARSLPITLDGRDMVGIAQTGSGKTVAFVLPLLMRLHQEPNSNALVLAPTRELAQQIETVVRQLTAKLPELRLALLIGGTSMVPQIRNLKKEPRILVATPGRLVDHLRSRNTNLKNTTVLVLDEADRMLDMGFIPQIEQILKYVPTERQTMLFSATWPKEIQALSRRYLKNPSQVKIPSPQSSAPKITQNLVHTAGDRKRETLLEELLKRPAQTIVFAKTQHRTDRVAHYLLKAGLSVGLIHGGRSQGQRKRALDEFRGGKIQILVATDIAARGLDIPEVAHVVNFDLPMVAEDYVHRIGRTARAGREGEALSILAPEDRGLWKDIEKLLKTRAQQA